MTEQRKQSAPITVGGSTLLTIFCVLCLTVFAALALTTVQSDVRLSESSAQAITAYYAADAQAEAILARLRAGEQPEGVYVLDGIWSYSVPISDTQDLEVDVWLNGPDYEVLRWQAVSTVDWETDEHLDVWDGDGLFA